MAGGDTLAAVPISNQTPYTCPMHPQVRRDGPGNCPICGMTLEPVKATAEPEPNKELADISRRFWIGLAFGAAFPLLKMFEWIPEIRSGLTPGTNLFFMYYYVMTGLHLCHVALGLVIICFIVRNLKTSKAPKISFVETGATYWHMVDVLWLVLFALLYLMR